LLHIVGPMGICEEMDYAHGTLAIMSYIASMKTRDAATTVACGGETVSFIESVMKDDPTHGYQHFSHVSTGGGAALEFLEGKTLPGVEGLMDAKK
jgi:phosphoglycerate kinase